MGKAQGSKSNGTGFQRTVTQALEAQQGRTSARPIHPPVPPVAPVVGSLGILLIVNVVVCHQQVLALDQVFVVFSHVRADPKAANERGISRVHDPRTGLTQHTCFPPRS